MGPTSVIGFIILLTHHRIAANPLEPSNFLLFFLISNMQFSSNFLNTYT